MRASLQRRSARAQRGRRDVEVVACREPTVHVSQVSKCEMRIFSSPPKTAVIKSISKSNLRSSPCWGPC
jgi:hypothetical protein